MLAALMNVGVVGRQRAAPALADPFAPNAAATPTTAAPPPGTARTMKEHCPEVIEIYHRRLETNPSSLFDHLQRTAFALWLGPAKAIEYLQQFDDVLTAYNASACASRVKRILGRPPPQCGRLLPPALMLAPKAVVKEPENPEYRQVLEKALQSQR